MGITYQTFNLLKNNIEKFGSLGSVLTLGRLGNQIDKTKLKKLGLEKNKAFSEEYSEKILLEYFNADSVDSIDNSEFENASIIHDMNEDFQFINKQYDTIIDIGTSEHIFNINQNLINISKLCKSGGRIIHCLPANNQCGHGFYQFSPELFFSLYNESNGYQSTNLFLIDNHDNKNYWQIKEKPKNERLELNSFTPLYIFVSTIKKVEGISQKVQQSDYENVWGITSHDTKNPTNKKHLMSIKWKKIKDIIKLFFRNNYLFKSFFIKYENKKNFLKNFYKNKKYLIKLNYDI